MASLSATWDLRCSSIPRSVCCYPAPGSSSSTAASSNPFEQQQQQQQYISSRASPYDNEQRNKNKRSTNTATNAFDVAALEAEEQQYGSSNISIQQSSSPYMQQQQQQAGTNNNTNLGKYALVFGTERGGLRYRVYPDIKQQQQQQSSNRNIMGSNSGLVQPLGAGNIPNTNNNHHMVDLNGAVSGSIISIIQCTDNNINANESILNTKKNITNNNNIVPIFLVLVDDNRGPSSNSTTSPGSYASYMLLKQSTTFTLKKQTTNISLPRMCCVTYHKNTGFVYAAGQHVYSLCIHSSYNQLVEEGVLGGQQPHVIYNASKILPSPGIRTNTDAICVTSNGSLVICAVNNSFYGITNNTSSSNNNTNAATTNVILFKIWNFTQSSQVHPAICCKKEEENVLVLASGRECISVNHKLIHPTKSSTVVSRYGVTTLPSAILSLCIPSSSNNNSITHHCGILTFDGLLHIRHIPCLSVPFVVVELGNSPNNFFYISSLDNTTLLGISYSGEGRVISLLPHTIQEEADRLLKLSINAFGTQHFPRLDVAEALRSSFAAANFAAASEPTVQAKDILRQYLETVILNLYKEPNNNNNNSSSNNNTNDLSTTSLSYPFLVIGTAMLCLCASYMNNASLANRASKSAALKIHQYFPHTLQTLLSNSTNNSSASAKSLIAVCEFVCHRLLKESTKMDLLPQNATATSNNNMEFVEAAVWLLRSCGKHCRAMEILRDKVLNSSTSSSSSSSSSTWSRIKYESYTAAHLAELWCSPNPDENQLVLDSSITKDLLQSNPTLALGVFLSNHPQKERDWMDMQKVEEDPLSHKFPTRVVQLLKTVQPNSNNYHGTGILSSFSNDSATTVPPSPTGRVNNPDGPLPLQSGRALAVTYLESAVGISTNRPCFEEDPFDKLAPDIGFENRVANLHDELVFLLLEGVILERGPDNEKNNNNNEYDENHDSQLGSIYRYKLRRLLSWPNAKYHPDKVVQTLPKSFLREHALLLGRLGNHEEALRILYCELQSLDLALEYCDDRYLRMQRRQQANGENIHHQAGNNNTSSSTSTCVYLPLVKVALESDKGDEGRGTRSAIQVLALRRSAIDRAAALRLLPDHLPVSAVARPFLIPALIDSESQVHRLTVASALLRAKYLSLKRALTEAQIRSQAVLHAIPALQNLNLGDIIHTTKPFYIRNTHSVPSPSFPEIVLVKYFFPRHLVIQAKISNNSVRVLTDVAFVVADSSDDSILATTFVPLKTLPPNTTGSAWCVLSASPLRLDGIAILTCELRYTILSVDLATGVPLSFGTGKGRTYVEELQDVEVRSSEFEM